MAEEATVGYTYSEAPSASYEYTYKEPTAIHEVPTHRILHKLRTELPHIAHKIPQIAISAKEHSPAMQRSILGIAHAFLAGEEGLIKMRLEHLKYMEASGKKLTPQEEQMKKRAEMMLQRIQFLKGGVDEKKERLEKEHQLGKYKDMTKLEEVV
jgi:hypothetical protein